MKRGGTSVKVTTKHVLILCALAFSLNMLFWYSFEDQRNERAGHIWNLEVAYNIYAYNTPMFNDKRCGFAGDVLQNTDYLPDYRTIDHKKFGKPNRYPSPVKTIAYGVITGILWKLTGVTNPSPMIFLQIILYVLCMVMIYHTALLIFRSEQSAFIASLVHLLFLPMIYLNVQYLPDAWVYYGCTVLLYTTVAIFKTYATSWFWLFLATSCLFTLAFWVRPTLLALLLVFGVFSVLLWTMRDVKKIYKQRFTFLFMCLIGSNIVGYWLPFTMYNKQIYGDYFVGPQGLGLLTGLGRLPNKWGYKLNDPWYYQFMRKKFGINGLDAQSNKQARILFLQALREDPMHLIKIFVRSVPRILFPGLPWYPYLQFHEYNQLERFALKDRIVFYLKNWGLIKILFDFLAHQVYVRLYLLVGYLGLVYACLRRRWVLASAVSMIIFSPWMWLLMHIEHRYLISHYAFFSFFVSSFICHFLNMCDGYSL